MGTVCIHISWQWWSLSSEYSRSTGRTSYIKGTNEHWEGECKMIRYKAYIQEHQTLKLYICMHFTAIQTAWNWLPCNYVSIPLLYLVCH
jgi:hypothetical protein